MTARKSLDTQECPPSGRDWVHIVKLGAPFL
jgi:hypothetical protein